MLKNTLRAIIMLCSVVSITFADRPRNTTIYIASIQFPASIKQLPDVCAYFSGSKISCKKDNDLHRIFFDISTERSMQKLYLLVVENSSFKTEDNTVKYLKVKSNDAYKLWSLELMHKKNRTNAIEQKVVGGIKLNSDEESPYYWIIHEEAIPEHTGQIPDNTLIMLYKPEFIRGLEGGSGVKLPTVIVASNVLELVGSEEKLHDLSISYVLSSLDLNTFHAQSTDEIKHHPTGNRITICTT